MTVKRSRKAGSPRPAPAGYVQAIEGEWIRMHSRTGFREQCCGCGLVHVVDYRVRDGRLEFRARVDKRGTASARRPFKSGDVSV